MKHELAGSLLIALTVFASFPLAAELNYLGPTERPLAAYLPAVPTETEKSGRETMNIVHEGPSDLIFIFGAANAPGKYGSYFRTDLLLSGSGMGKGTIVFYVWVLPAARDNRSVQGRRYSMPDNNFEVFPDIVGAFGVSGGATIFIQVDYTASTSTGAHCLLSAWGRTYTAGAAGGSYSTTLPATFGYLVTPSTYTDAPGAVVTAARRTNVACFNHNSVTATCRATVFGTDGSVQASIDLSVPPYSSVQRSLDGLYLPEPGGDVLFSTTSGYLTGYIVVDDNVTNDGDVYLASYRETTACPNIGGTWVGAFVDRCGNYGAGYVVISQSGCSFTMASSIGTFSGRLWGSMGKFNISVSPCSGSASGDFTVFSSQGISGTYSGTVSGSGCCGPSLSGSFTLGR